jgi:hypothetical protein
VAATAPIPLEDQDPVVLQLLQLAAEAILAHPRAVPPGLYEQCSSWADGLAGALSPPNPSTPLEPRQRQGSARDALLAAGPRTRTDAAP